MGHAWCIESETGIAIFVEEYEATGAFSAIGEKLYRCLSRAHGRRARRAKKIRGGFRHDHSHDRFAIAGRRNTAGFGIRITAAANQRGVTDASWELATGAARGCGGVEPALRIEGNSADRSLFVAAMMFSSVRIFTAAEPGFPLDR